MRITFPALSSAGAWNVCCQAALACLPLAVDFLAKRFLKNYASARFLGWGALPTLKDNYWTLGGGALLLALHQIYSFWSEVPPDVPISEPKHIEANTSVATSAPPPIETSLPPPSLSNNVEPAELLMSIPILIKYIEAGITEERLYEMGKSGSIKTNDGLTAASVEIPTLKGAERARKAAALFKGELQRLKTPLLEPIQEDLLTASKSDKPFNGYNAAVEKLDVNRKALFKLIIEHLSHVAAQNKLNSAQLAAIFEPILFKMQSVDLALARAEIISHVTVLIYFIESGIPKP
jgi:hypothetical protein